MSDKTKEIQAIENKYGLVLFRMALTHLVDVGVRALDDEGVEESMRQIKARDEVYQNEGKIPVMTPEFQYEIVHCAAELAQIGIWDLFAYIKKFVQIQ